MLEVPVSKTDRSEILPKVDRRTNDPSRTVILLNVTGGLPKLSKHRNLKSKVAIYISYQLK